MHNHSNEVFRCRKSMQSPNESCQKTTKLAGWKKVLGKGQGYRGQSFGVHANVLSKGIYVLNIKGFPQFV